MRVLPALLLGFIAGAVLFSITPLGLQLRYSAIGNALTSLVERVPRPCVDIYSGYPLTPIYQAEEVEPINLLPGLTHATLAGKVHHGTRSMELWMETIAPGGKLPIHRHDCEEIFLVLKGSGVARIQAKDGTVVSARLQANTTFTVLPNSRHMLENDGTEDLHAIAVIDRAPMKVYVYQSWEDAYSSGQLVWPMFWDRQCPTKYPPAFSHLRGPQQKKQEL